MTHLIVLVEGFKEGFGQFERDIKQLKYEITEGMQGEVSLRKGNPRWGNPTIREFKLYDITVKRCFRDKFLGDMKRYSGGSYVDLLSNDRHGVDEKGFKVGVFRKMLQTALSMLNCKPIDWSKIKESHIDQVKEVMIKNKSSWHCHNMFLGELPDFIKKQGPRKGREMS